MAPSDHRDCLCASIMSFVTTDFYYYETFTLSVFVKLVKKSIFFFTEEVSSFLKCCVCSRNLRRKISWKANLNYERHDERVWFEIKFSKRKKDIKCWRNGRVSNEHVYHERDTFLNEEFLRRKENGFFTGWKSSFLVRLRHWLRHENHFVPFILTPRSLTSLCLDESSLGLLDSWFFRFTGGN